MNAPTAPAALATPETPVRQVTIALADLYPSPTNPRRTFPEGPLAELADTIRRHGVLQPILVRPSPVMPGQYEIVAGERRYRASIQAGLAEIPATVRDLTDTDVLEIQVLENLQREDVHPLEEAEGYQVLMLRTAYTVEDVAAKLGRSKAYIYARLKLCAITGEARQAFLDGKLSASVALLIARIPVPALQQQATREVLEGYAGPMSARQASEHLQRKYMLRLAEAPFPRGDAKLLADAPKCKDCPKRTGHAPELWPDVQSADVCTDPECYGAKRTAWRDRQAEVAAAAGKKVVIGKAAEKIAPYGFSDYNQHLSGGLAYLDAVAIGALADKKGRVPTWRQLLAESCPEATTVIEDTRRGTLHEAAPVADLRQAAMNAGIKVASTQRGDPSTQMEREREKVARDQTARRRALVEQIVQASQGMHLSLDELRSVAAVAFDHHDFEAQKLACRIWGLEGKIERSHCADLVAAIHQMDGADIHRVLRLITHVSRIHVNSYSSEPTKLPTDLVDACIEWGIDTDLASAGSGKKAPSGSGVAYRHPDPASGLSWSGRGKQPAWVVAWLKEGGSLDDMRVVK